MLILLKNLHCFAPKYIGKNDILICRDKIYKIRPSIECCEQDLIEYDCEGLAAFPGLIDQHVHIIGGGGERGFASHIKEIEFNDIVGAGVSTLVGLLGADSFSKSLEALHAKAKALDFQGITTFIYSGSYSLPIATLTGNIIRDLVLVDKVIGVGEIAISDHRASHFSLNDMLRLASDVHLAGLLSGKAGIVNFHVGDGKDGLKVLFDILDASDLPVDGFIPTHLNRNEELFMQGVSYCKRGGYIDLTAGESKGIAVPEAVGRLLGCGADMSRVTVSSDANGSTPDGQVGRIGDLYEDIVKCITENNIDAGIAFSLVTENTAKLLKIYPQKGTLFRGSDADILIVDKSYNVRKLFCRGKLLVDD